MRYAIRTLLHISLSACMFFLSAAIHPKMKIIECFDKSFPNDIVPTEKTCYELLKKNPLSSDVTYYAVPWTYLINTNRLHLLPKHTAKGNSFTICQHAHGMKILPSLKKMGIKTLFAVFADQRKNINGIEIVPIPHLAKNTTSPAPVKDIFYTFLGSNLHPCRKAIFAMNHSENCLVKKRPTFYFLYKSDPQWIEHGREYLNAMARARFSLCPRGGGIASYRFWESLKPGAIPVLIADGIRLPEWFDWDNCIVQVAEKDVAKIPQILSNISAEKESIMRENCYKAHRLFQEENLVSCIRKYFKEF